MTTAAIQALAKGLPLIATRHSGFSDMVHEDKNGFLVDEGDYRQLAEKIIYLMDHPELLSEFGVYGRKLVGSKYDASVLIGRQIEIYRSIING